MGIIVSTSVGQEQTHRVKNCDFNWLYLSFEFTVIQFHKVTRYLSYFQLIKKFEHKFLQRLFKLLLILVYNFRLLSVLLQYPAHLVLLGRWLNDVAACFKICHGMDKIRLNIKIVFSKILLLTLFTDYKMSLMNDVFFMMKVF